MDKSLWCHVFYGPQCSMWVYRPILLQWGNILLSIKLKA